MTSLVGFIMALWCEDKRCLLLLLVSVGSSVWHGWLICWGLCAGAHQVSFWWEAAESQRQKVFSSVSCSRLYQIFFFLHPTYSLLMLFYICVIDLNKLNFHVLILSTFSLLFYIYCTVHLLSVCLASFFTNLFSPKQSLHWKCHATDVRTPLVIGQSDQQSNVHSSPFYYCQNGEILHGIVMLFSLKKEETKMVLACQQQQDPEIP